MNNKTNVSDELYESLLQVMQLPESRITFGPVDSGHLAVEISCAAPDGGIAKMRRIASVACLDDAVIGAGAALAAEIDAAYEILYRTIYPDHAGRD